MDNPPEGENKQTPQNLSNQQASVPAPFVSAPLPPFPTVVSTPGIEPASSDLNGNLEQPSTNHAGILILQWLTYAFWGWTVLILSALTASVFVRLLAGQDVSTFNYYTAAGLIVLLPIAFVCDLIYSKSEPDKKTGASSIVMVIHAVIFALFTIGSLLFAAWSVVSIATQKVDRSSTVAGLCSALLISVFYAITFIRTLNPAHIRWIPKVYRFTMLAIVILFIILGFTKPTFNSAAANKNNTTYNFHGNGSLANPDTQSSPDTSTPSNNVGANGKLEPSVVGDTQCDIPTLADGSTTGQVALTGGSTCDEAEANIQSANGKNGGNYTANGYNCTSTKQGANTQWSSYWDNDFYSYNCTSGSKQLAFNLQTTAQNQASSALTN